MRKIGLLKQGLVVLLTIGMSLWPCAPGSFTVFADSAEISTEVETDTVGEETSNGEEDAGTEEDAGSGEADEVSEETFEDSAEDAAGDSVSADDCAEKDNEDAAEASEEDSNEDAAEASEEDSNEDAAEVSEVEASEQGTDESGIGESEGGEVTSSDDITEDGVSSETAIENEEEASAADPGEEASDADPGEENSDADPEEEIPAGDPEVDTSSADNEVEASAAVQEEENAALEDDKNEISPEVSEEKTAAVLEETEEAKAEEAKAEEDEAEEAEAEVTEEEGLLSEGAVLKEETPFYEDADAQTAGGFVTRMYSVVLGRMPDKSGYEYWEKSLTSGTAKASAIIEGFFASGEYKNGNKNNSEIVTDYYHAVLNREPDAGGLKNWKSKLDVGMTNQVLNAGFINSSEFKRLCGYYGINQGSSTVKLYRDRNYERTYFFHRLYKNCLDRIPDTSGLEHWCQVVTTGRTGAQAAQGFVFSKEYLDKHTENEEYVTMLYQTIMGRSADSSGLNHWVNQLNYSNTREHVLNGFLFSDEFKGQCSKAGINVGNRIAEPDAGKEWQYNVQMLKLCNDARAENGLEALTTREDLWKDVAMLRAEETTEYFSHTRPDGTSCWTAYDDAGITGYGMAENIAAGNSTVNATFRQWMNSAGHRANILTNICDKLATGYFFDRTGQYRYYWCQNFLY